MVERYHVVLWAVAVGVGAAVAGVLALADRFVPPTSDRSGRPDAGTPATSGLLVVAVVVAIGVAVVAGGATGRDAALVGLVAATPEVFGRLRRRAGSRRADRSGSSDERLVAALGVVSLLGVWAAVPDTEPAVVAAGVVALPAVLAWRRGSGPGDRWALVVAVVAAAWAGSAGLPELVGGLGCVGLLIVPPVAWRRRRLAVAGHLALVAVSSRMVTRLDWGPATVAVLAGATVVLVAALGSGALRPGGPGGLRPGVPARR